MHTWLIAAMFTANALIPPERPTEGESGWQSLPLVTDGRIDPGWSHTGWGSFGIERGTLRTDCDEKGMGLLLYTRQRFGNCQIRIVYRGKDSRANSGAFIRIDDGILERLADPTPAARRKPDGSLADGSLEQLIAASDKELGPWYAVHHGFEVQICDEADEKHRTGSLYSLSRAAELPKPQGDWRTMIITLQGNKVEVSVDGKRVSDFDSERIGPRPDRKWYEPKTDAKRPVAGYIGLQNHDPGDVVYFKEVSVRAIK